MKLRILMATAFLAVLAGCGTVTPMVELERQAMATGDWSAVERRERILVRQKMNSGMICPNGYIGYCESDFGRTNCSCVGRDSIRSALMR